MFIIDWVFDKMGYTKKVDWTTVFGQCEVTLDLPNRKTKVATKKPAAKKKVVRKTVRKKA